MEFVTACDTLVGLRHKQNDIECQDICKDWYGNGITTIALADGMGSTTNGRVAADIAVNEALDMVSYSFYKLLNMSAKDAKRFIAKNVRAATLNAAEDPKDIDQWASTLLLAATDGKYLLTFQCGDGAIWIFKDGKARQVGKAPNYGAKNVTLAIQPAVMIDDMCIAKGDANGFEGFVMCSDGCSDWLFHDPYNEENVAASIIDSARMFGRDSAIAEMRIAMANHQSKGYNFTDDMAIAALVAPNNNEGWIEP